MTMSAEMDVQVADFVKRVVGAMGLTLDVAFEERDDNVRLNLSGEGADALLSRQGEVLDALQVIVNTAFRRDARGDRHYIVDALGFRKEKDEALRQQVAALMEQARTTSLPQEIGPLNPYARRIVHLTVAEDVALASESVGDAFLKTVIISRKT
jgi:spoIIIJ-associated protein